MWDEETRCLKVTWGAEPEWFLQEAVEQNGAKILPKWIGKLNPDSAGGRASSGGGHGAGATPELLQDLGFVSLPLDIHGGFW